MIVYISVLRWLDNKGNKEEKKKRGSCSSSLRQIPRYQQTTEITFFQRSREAERS